MSDAPATPVAVVRHLSALTLELDKTTRAYREAEITAAQLRHQANMAETHAFLAASGAVELRKQHARIAADELEGKALVAEAVVRAMRAELRTLDTRIGVGRTYGATVRAEFQTLGMSEAA